MITHALLLQEDEEKLYVEVSADQMYYTKVLESVSPDSGNNFMETLEQN